MSGNTVPMCDACWQIQAYCDGEPEREPVRMRDAVAEICFCCKKPTLSGIYVRRKVDDIDDRRTP